MKPISGIKEWLRCAKIADRQYETVKAPDANTIFPSEGFDLSNVVDQVTASQRRLTHVRKKGWQTAYGMVKQDYGRQLRKLRQQIDAEVSAVEALRIGSFQASLSDIVRDLAILEQDFCEVSFYPRLKLLSVTTKEIQLEDLPLGTFDISLRLDSLSNSERGYYEVIAIDPNTAANNDDVTHPHVQNKLLCEGDAQPSIKRALMQGRLLDFFQIVEQVLGTYNADSAYVSIRDWQGSACRHCGSSTDEDECRDCEACGTSICDGCVYVCNTCGECFCGNCDRACNGCLNSVCGACSAVCCECSDSFCKDCLNESERCDECKKEAKEEPDAGSAKPAIHGQRVGETAVPA